MSKVIEGATNFSMEVWNQKIPSSLDCVNENEYNLKNRDIDSIKI